MNRTFTQKNAYSLAAQDIISGLKNWHIWGLLGWQEIQLRYRRSYLGPFWITINMAILIYSMGFLYGHLFKMELSHYYPALASGMLAWTFISSVIIESTNAFISAENYIKQIKLPFSTYLLKLIYKNIIIFLHNITVMIPLILIFKIKISFATLFLIPSMFLMSCLAFIYGGFLSIMGARFRDLSQIIASLTQIIFFLTPIMWTPDILPERYQNYIVFNPFAQVVELIRNPLLGKIPSMISISTTLILIFTGLGITFFIFAKKRKQIVYWL